MLKINGHLVNLTYREGQWHATIEDIPGMDANANTAIKAIDLIKKLIESHDESMRKNKPGKATEDQHGNGFLRTKIKRKWNG